MTFVLTFGEAVPNAAAASPACEEASADIPPEACSMAVVWARCKLLFCRDVGGVSRAGTATFAYLCY